MDRIRNICLVLILLLWCGNLWAHTTEKIERVEFVFEAKDGRGAEIYNDSGTLLLHASRFRMEMADDLLMVSDGKTIWIYRPQTEDVIIMDADIANLQSASDDDKSLEQTLHTLAGLFGYSHSNSSEIKIERSTNGTLSKILFNSKDKSIYTVKIKSIANITSQTDAVELYFTFRSEDYPNAIITDLR